MRIYCVTRKTFLILAAVTLGMSETLLPAQTNQGWKDIRPIHVSHLIGMRVENRDGKELGSLRDLALDLHTGRIRYAIVASGGFLGVRPRLRAVPPHLLSAATAKRDTLALSLAVEDWQKAPSFRLSELRTLGRPEHYEAINEFYRQATTEPSKNANSGNGTLMRTGRDAEDPPALSQTDELILASNLIGGVVRDRGGQRFGEIADSLVVLDERMPVFAIVSEGGLFKDRGRYYGVSLRAMQRDARGRWTLNADRTTLEQAPPFAGRLPGPGESSGRTELFRYYESK